MLIPIELQQLEIVLKEITKSSPGLDQIPFQYIEKTWLALRHVLLHLYNICLKYHFHPEQWKTTETIILAKDFKSDYSIPKAYRPIALSYLILPCYI